MRKFLITAIAVSSLALWGAAVRAEDKKDDKKEKDKGWHGILIDKACGEGKKSDKAAEHPKSCATKESCAKSGYGIVVEDKFIKFDEKGDEKAKKYLEEKDHGTKVHVTGKLSDDKKTLTVDEIHADKEKKDDKKKES